MSKTLVRFHAAGIVAIFFLSAGTLSVRASAAETPEFLEFQIVRLDSVDTDSVNMAVKFCYVTPDKKGLACGDQDDHALKATDPGIRAKLKQYAVGDYLRVDLVKENKTDRENEAAQGKEAVPGQADGHDNGADRVSAVREIRDVRGFWYSPPDSSLSPWVRFLVLFACAAFLLGFASAVTRSSPQSFIIGQDGRYSNSKFQFAIWFWLGLSSYLATVIFRIWWAGWDFFGGVNIPQNLLVLSGLSALTYGGAKAITTAKADKANREFPQAMANAAAMQAANPNIVVAPPARKTTMTKGDARFFRDLVQNDDGGFDFGDFQMLVVTLLAVVMYLMLVFHFLHAIEFRKSISLPDVDTTVLALFGLGQGAYLTKKAAGDVGKS